MPNIKFSVKTTDQIRMYTGIRSVYRDQIRLPVSDPYTGIRSVYRYPIGKINSEPDVDSDSQLTAKYFQLFVIFLLRIRNRTSKSEPDLDKSHPDLDNTDCSKDFLNFPNLLKCDFLGPKANNYRTFPCR